MASVSYGQPWFTRNRMAPELEEHVFCTSKKVFVDSDGKDLRIKNPGFNWLHVRDKRREVFQNASQQLTTMFEKYYEKITGQKSDRSEPESNNTPVLPSMKTPGLSRLRSRVEKSTLDEEVVLNLVFSSPDQPDNSRVNKTSQKVENTLVGKVSDQVDIVDLPANDAPNTQQAAHVIGISKLTLKNRTRGPSNSNQSKTLDEENTGHKNRDKLREDDWNSPLSSDDDLLPDTTWRRSMRSTKRKERKAKVTTTRVTRSRACNPTINTHKISAESEENDLNSPLPSGDDLPDPTWRRSTRSTKPNERKTKVATTLVTRSRACKPTVNTDKKETKSLAIEKTANKINSPPTIVVHSSTVGVDSDQTLVVKKNELFRKLSTSSRKSSGVCQVTIEKIQFCSPAPEAINIQKGTGISFEAANNDLSIPNAPTAPLESNPDSNSESVESQVEVPPSMVIDSEGDAEVPLAKPTPPRQKPTRLNKRAGKGKANKPRVDVLKKQLDVPTASLNGNENDPPSGGDSPLPSSSESKDSPVKVSYLTQTPRTIQNLQEEHRLRSGGKLVSLSQLFNSGGRNSPSLKKAAAKTPKEAHPTMRAKTPTPTSSNTITKIPKPTGQFIAGGKRLRSLSLEKLTDLEEYKENRKRSKSVTSSPETSEENSSDDQQCGAGMEHVPSPESNFSPDSLYQDLPRRSPSEALSYFYNHKKKPASYSKGSGDRGSSSNQVLSFIPHKIAKKAETFEARQECLADKVRQKNEEEEKRKQEIKALKHMEVMEKVKKREDRMKRVAERQAALKRKDDEKNMKIKDQQDKNQLLMVNQKKAKEVEEKNKKLKNRMMAAEIKRKQEEAHQKRRLQQLEEERRMASELAIKRREKDEEEKKLKRQEKHRLEKERQMKHEEEMKEKQKQLLIKQKQQQSEANKKVPTEAPLRSHTSLKKQFEELLGGAMAKVPVVTSKLDSGNYLTIKERADVEVENSTGKTKTIELKNAFFNRLPAKPTNVLSSAESRLNATFTKESEAGADIFVQTPISKTVAPASYEMTPAENDPLYAYENYDIGNLSSDDSTDDDECPKKVLPIWARSHSLNNFMLSQEDDLNEDRVDVMRIFPPEQLLKYPDLNMIFRHKRQRFFQRTSSAQWNSPMIKKSRLV